MQLIGQKTNIEIINKIKQLPSFIIIQGDRYSGKTFFVSYLCNLYGLHCVKVGNSVSEVRKLVECMKPNSNTVYYFENFESASIQAKNALLKITEETPIGNYIMITGSSQISTLESRARKIILEPYTYDMLSDFLSKYFSEDLCKKLYIAGINTPAKCIKYKEYENIEQLVNYVFEIYQSISCLTFLDILSIVSRFETRYENKFDSCKAFIYMLINIINYNSKNLLDCKFSYRNTLNLLVECLNDLEHNDTLNRKMLLYRTFYQIYLLKGKI